MTFLQLQSILLGLHSGLFPSIIITCMSMTLLNLQTFLYNKINQIHQFPKFAPEWNSIVSGSSSAHHQEIIHCTLGTGICHTGLKTSFAQDQDWTARKLFHPGPARRMSSDLYDIFQCRVNSEYTSGYRQRNCPKQVEFHAGVNLRNWCIWLVLL
jgi:hypothetical protein